MENKNILAEQYKAMEHEADTDAAEALKVMEEGVAEGYKVIEDSVVEGYKKMENTFVDAYKKVEDTFVEKYFVRDGESIEDAKKRLQGK